MKIILRQDIPGFGRRGDIKEVAIGYGRNYLIPRGLALESRHPAAKALTKAVIAKHQADKADVEAAKFMATRLEGMQITLKAKARGDKLFGAIREADLASALGLQKKQISIQPIKMIGEHKVIVKLQHGFKATVIVRIVRDE